MDISFSNEFRCISAATGARISSSQEEIMCFYSVPTSPSFKVKASSLSGSQTEPTTPRTYEDANSNLLEFEFETSRRFNPSDLETDTRPEEEDDEKQKQRPQRQCGDSLPTVAFADELFCNGKVLPLGPPLKLPPRLQNGSGKKTNTPSSTAFLSPRSLGSSSLRLRFLQQSLWNDDFDPFMVALEVVKGEEKRGKSRGRHDIRRTRSLSPFRGEGPNRPSEGHCGPGELVCEVLREPLMPRSRSPEMVLCEPKGLVFTRRVRSVGVDKNGSIGPNRSKEESESGGAWTRKRKREKIIRFLFRKASAQHKLKDQKDETVSEVKKMTMTCYKPRLLLCLGYGGGRYVK